MYFPQTFKTHDYTHIWSLLVFWNSPIFVLTEVMNCDHFRDIWPIRFYINWPSHSHEGLWVTSVMSLPVLLVISRVTWHFQLTWFAQNPLPVVEWESILIMIALIIFFWILFLCDLKLIEYMSVRNNCINLVKFY